MKFRNLILAVWAIASVASYSGSASAKRIPLMKGITIVRYYTLVADTFEQCKIDWKALAIDIKFVTEQASKLKFVDTHEHYEHTQDLYAQLQTLPFGEASHIAANQAAYRYNHMPSLKIFVSAFPQGLDCVAEIETTLNVAVESVTGSGPLNPNIRIIATGETFYSAPEVQLWDESTFAVGRSDFYSRTSQAITTSIKKFVNDWSDSQEGLH